MTGFIVFSEGDAVFQRIACCLLIFSITLSVGCQRKFPNHPARDSSAESVLLRASGACLAKISKLEEIDERAEDGDHFVKAWLEPIEASGFVPEFLYLVIEHGGNMPLESYQELQQREMTLRHDSLKVGELHWFIFSEDYDASKFPYQVAAWWKYAEGIVPQDVITAIRNDRFRNIPSETKFSMSSTQPAKKEKRFSFLYAMQTRSLSKEQFFRKLFRES